MTRHWSINGRFLGQLPTGVQRYALEIVRALDRHAAAGHPLARDLALELVLPGGVAAPAGLTAITARTVAGGPRYVWEQTHLAAACTGGLLSLCNMGPVALRRQILCVHDLNMRLAPESYTLRFRLPYRLLLPVLGRTVSRVTTVSQFSAAQLARFGICAAEKVRVIPNGHEHALRIQPAHSAATRAAAGPRTIVVLGGEAPHKNAAAVLSLAPALREMGLRIALVGVVAPGVFRAGGAPSEWAEDNIVRLGRVEDAELVALLKDSLCLACPSLTEGFGLPPLEAMALGCPVVASDRGALPETCGAAALLAPPLARDLWLQHFQRLVHDDRLRADLIARGRAQACKFRWADSAEAYLEAMAQVDAE